MLGLAKKGAPHTLSTFTPRNPEEYFANQNMTEAAKSVAAVADAIAKEATESQRAYERFYNNLALFSGGTLALSVTYLGYLKTLSKPISHQKWLVASWIFLIVCVACSLFWTLLYTHYGHFARMREYMEAQKKKFETEAKEIRHLNIVNLGPAELEVFIGSRQKAAAVRDNDAKYHKRRENVYNKAWQWTGRLARLTFVGGLALLLAFAIKNM